MKYLVVLDRSSIIGDEYASGANGGTIKLGGVEHSALDCKEILHEMYYLLVTRDMKRHGGGSQTIYIPHSAVAFILGYDKGDPLPMGFSASTECWNLIRLEEAI